MVDKKKPGSLASFFLKHGPALGKSNEFLAFQELMAKTLASTSNALTDEQVQKIQAETGHVPPPWAYKPYGGVGPHSFGTAFEKDFSAHYQQQQPTPAHLSKFHHNDFYAGAPLPVMFPEPGTPPTLAKGKQASYMILDDLEPQQMKEPKQPPQLSKALVKSQGHTVNHGSAGGQTIIAVGPQGGQIVGYSHGPKGLVPIYAGSPKAVALAASHQAALPTHKAAHWLDAIGISHDITAEFPHQATVVVSKDHADVLVQHYGVKPISGGFGHHAFSTHALAAAASKGPAPAHVTLDQGAATAGGELEKDDPFPSLALLKQAPDAGKFAGSHNNQLWTGPDGAKFVYKGEDQKIARAEEAASRIGRLIVGEDRMPPARVVAHGGKNGALIKVVEGTPIGVETHKSVATPKLEKFAGQIGEHHVLDWLLSNHDGHAGNFLVDGDRLVAIDKGQAWKALGKDQLSTGYQLNSSPPIYNYFWKSITDGTLSPAAKQAALAGVEAALGKVEALSDAQYRALIAPYIATPYAGGMSGKKPAEMEALMLARKNSMRSDFQAFLSGQGLALDKKAPPPTPVAPKVAAPKPAPVQPKPPKIAATALTAKELHAYPEGLTLQVHGLSQEQAVGLGGVGNAASFTKKGTDWVNAKFPQGINSVALAAVTSIADSLTITAPPPPAPVVEVAKAPAPTPGWPKTVKAITVHHPGTAPSIPWPEAYPGPGYHAAVTVSGKPYEFRALGGNTLAIEVTYPDGTKFVHDSWSKACESTALFAKGLALDLDAVQKKALKIGVNGKKLLGLEDGGPFAEHVKAAKQASPAATPAIDLASVPPSVQAEIQVHTPHITAPTVELDGQAVPVSYSAEIIKIDSDTTTPIKISAKKIPSEANWGWFEHNGTMPNAAKLSQLHPSTRIKVLHPEGKAPAILVRTEEEPGWLLQADAFEGTSAKLGHNVVAEMLAHPGSKVWIDGWGSAEHFADLGKSSAPVVLPEVVASEPLPPVPVAQDAAKAEVTFKLAFGAGKAKEHAQALKNAPIGSWVTSPGGNTTWVKNSTGGWEQPAWQTGGAPVYTDIGNVVQMAFGGTLTHPAVQAELPHVEPPAKVEAAPTFTTQILKGDAPAGSHKNVVDAFDHVKGLKLMHGSKPVGIDPWIPPAKTWIKVQTSKGPGYARTLLYGNGSTTLPELEVVLESGHLFDGTLADLANQGCEIDHDSLWSYSFAGGTPVDGEAAPQSAAVFQDAQASAPDEPTPPAPTKTVSASLPLTEALKHFALVKDDKGPGKFEISATTGGDYFLKYSFSDASESNPTLATEKLNALVAAQGITKKWAAHPKPTYLGALVALTGAEAAKLHAVELPAQDVPAVEAAHPGIEAASEPAAVALAPGATILSGDASIPVGTIAKFGSPAGLYEKTAGGWVNETSNLFAPILDGPGGFEVEIVSTPSGLKEGGAVQGIAALDALPVGSEVTLKAYGTSYYSKVGPDQWKMIHTNHPTSSIVYPTAGQDGAFNDYTSYVLQKLGTSGPSGPSGQSVGDVSVTGYANLKSLPIGSEVEFVSPHQTGPYATKIVYTKLGANTWKGPHGGNTHETEHAFYDDQAYKIVKLGTGAVAPAPAPKPPLPPPTPPTAVLTEHVATAAKPLTLEQIESAPEGTAVKLADGSIYTKNSHTSWTPIVPADGVYGYTKYDDTIVSSQPVLVKPSLPSVKVPKKIAWAKIPGNWKTLTIRDKINEAPIGSIVQNIATGENWITAKAPTSTTNRLLISLSTGAVMFSSTFAANYKSHGLAISKAAALTEDQVQLVFAEHDGTVTASVPTISIPTAAKKTPPPVHAPAFKPAPVDPLKAEKKLWVSAHAALTPHETRHLGVFMHQLGYGSTAVYARAAGGHVFVGDGSAELAGKLAGEHGQTVETPWGTLAKLSLQHVIDKTPQAGWIKGPDGGEYPFGTTFNPTETPAKPVKDALQESSGFHKFVPYTAPDKAFEQVVKWAGTSPGVKKVAEESKAQFGLSGPIVTGGANTLLFVKDSELSKPSGPPTVKVSAQLPPEPPALVSKALSGIAGTVPQAGTIAANNRDDLASAHEAIPTLHGYAIRFGAGGLLMDGQVKVYKIQQPGGATVTRVIGDLTRPTPTLSSGLQFGWLGSAKYSSGGSVIGDALFDHSTGTFQGSNTKIFDAGGSGRALASGATVYVHAHKFEALKRNFVVDVPDHVSPELAMAEAMAALGVDSAEAMKVPDEQDERIQKKMMALSNTIGSKGFRAIEDMQLHLQTAAQRELALDKALKARGVEPSMVVESKLVTSNGGTQVLEMHDLDSKLASISYLSTGVPFDGIARYFKQGGAIGLKEASLVGNAPKLAGATTSAVADMESGGTYGKFFRVISPKVTEHGSVGHSAPKLLVHPRALRRTNWYGFNSDEFGSQKIQGVQRSEITNVSSSANEVVLQCVEPADYVGVVVGTIKEKKELVQQLEALGHAGGFNGQPWDSFIIVGSVQALQSHKAKLPLAKAAL